jgi:hypothetical protein
MISISKMTDTVSGKRKKGSKRCHNCGKNSIDNFTYHPFYDTDVPLCNECVKLERFSINRTSSSEPLLSDSLISLDDNDVLTEVTDSIVRVLVNDDNDLANTVGYVSDITYQKPRILCAWCYTTDTEYYIKYGRCACGAVGMYTAVGLPFKN